MTTLLAATSATNAAATEGDVKTFLANMREFMADLLGTDSANKAAVAGFLGSLLNGKVDKSSGYSVVQGDRGKVINCTAGLTLNIAAASSLGDGFTFAVRNSGTGAVTIDPNLSEQINGQTSIVVSSGEFIIIYCDGAAFSTVGGSGAPPGAMMDYAGGTVPHGYLLCFGQAVSRSLYAALFAAIGTTHGAGDGSSTFNLPDFRGRVAAGLDDMGGTAASRLTSITQTLGSAGGAQTHTLSVGEMPSHTHNHPVAVNDAGGASGLQGFSPATVNQTAGSSTGGGGAHNNVQPTMMVNKIIKT